MIYIEVILLLVLACTGIYSSVTDVKNGIVHNRVLLCAVILGILLDVVYYGFFAQEFLSAFSINLLAAFVIAIVFYAYHIWAAGDSKLFILIAVLIPARLYSKDGTLALPSIGILIYTFSIAFAYVIVESIVLDIRQKRPLTLPSDFKAKSKTFVRQYLCCTVYLIAFYKIMQLVLPQEYRDNTQLLLLLSILFILTLTNFDSFQPPYVLLGSIAAVVGFIVSGAIRLEDLPDWKTFIIMVFLLLLREIGQHHNYDEITTENVEAGMVLSFATVAMFMNSKTPGLPQFTSEDIGSRISQSDAEAIKIWGKSKTGIDRIVIVRKIPFAIFISIGSLIVLCGVTMQCCSF